MPVNLKTDWKTIGRSGKTVDGREITEEMLKDAAELYDPDQYRAVVWPEHFQYYKMGSVEAVRLQKNGEGGLDLQAILVPNEYWLNANSYDQKTFTSMELTKLDKFEGRWYLTGLGATDNPASFGTSELRFNKKQSEVFRGSAVEFVLDAKPEKGSFLSSFFNKQTQEENQVDKTAFEALLNELKGIKEEFAKLQKEPKDKPKEENTEGTKFKALEDRLTEIEDKFSKLGDTKLEDSSDSIKALTDKLSELEAEFTAAMNTPHPGGTKPPEQTGEAFKKEDYL